MFMDWTWNLFGTTEDHKQVMHFWARTELEASHLLTSKYIAKHTIQNIVVLENKNKKHMYQWNRIVYAPSRFSRVWLSVTLWTTAFQAPLSMGFLRQEYWNGLPFPSPDNLPDPGTEPIESPALASVFFFVCLFLTTEPQKRKYFPWNLDSHYLKLKSQWHVYTE